MSKFTDNFRKAFSGAGRTLGWIPASRDDTRPIEFPDSESLKIARSRRGEDPIAAYEGRVREEFNPSLSRYGNGDDIVDENDYSVYTVEDQGHGKPKIYKKLRVGYDSNGAIAKVYELDDKGKVKQEYAGENDLSNFFTKNFDRDATAYNVVNETGMKSGDAVDGDFGQERLFSQTYNMDFNSGPYKAIRNPFAGADNDPIKSYREAYASNPKMVNGRKFTGYGYAAQPFNPYQAFEQAFRRKKHYNSIISGYGK